MNPWNGVIRTDVPRNTLIYSSKDQLNKAVADATVNFKWFKVYKLTGTMVKEFDSTKPVLQ